MPFLCEPIVETQFESMKDVDTWLSNNEDQLERTPNRNWIQKGARFFDDAYFGTKDRSLRFNKDSIRVLLQKLGLRLDTRQRVKRPGLISDLLNDLISQRDTRLPLSIGSLRPSPGKYAARVFNSPYRDKATMFDFINIFTEYARDQPIGKRLEMEERAGVLADRIVKNKRKFVSRKDVIRV